MKKLSILIYILTLFVLFACFPSKTVKRVKGTNTNETDTTTKENTYPLPAPYSPTPAPTPTDSGPSLEMAIRPYHFRIITHGKSSNKPVWSSQTDPRLISQEQQYKFSTDVRLQLRFKANPPPPSGKNYLAGVGMIPLSYDNYGKGCEYEPYTTKYSKIKLIVGIKSSSSNEYVDSKVIEVDIGQFSSVVELTAPSSGSYYVDILDMHSDSWCLAMGDTYSNNYCPYYAVTHLDCIDVEMDMATDWTQPL